MSVVRDPKSVYILAMDDDGRDLEIVVIGTLDTKLEEFTLLRSELEAAGAHVTVVDASTTVHDHPAADITSRELATRGGAVGASPGGDRASALATTSRGVTEILEQLHAEGRVHGVIGMGGSGNTELATSAMRALPIGVPKVMLSTASRGVAAFIGNSDITLIHSVTDIAGVNYLLARQIAQSAAAVVAMARAASSTLTRPSRIVALTMFGITTPGADALASDLRDRGYEVLVFHANGSGGRALEQLIAEGVVDAVVDLTPTELADELVGGHRSAGPDRLSAAGRLGLPQVLSLGGLDVVNFGAVESIPPHFRGRQLYGHASSSTLMRTNVRESAAIGRLLAEKLNESHGPGAVYAPLQGLSSLGRAGNPFHDPAADRALIDGVRAHLDPRFDLIEIDAHINDASFAAALANRLDQMYKEKHDHSH